MCSYIFINLQNAIYLLPFEITGTKSTKPLHSHVMPILALNNFVFFYIAIFLVVWLLKYRENKKFHYAFQPDPDTIISTANQLNALIKIHQWLVIIIINIDPHKFNCCNSECTKASLAARSGLSGDYNCVKICMLNKCTPACGRKLHAAHQPFRIHTPPEIVLHYTRRIFWQ